MIDLILALLEGLTGYALDWPDGTKRRPALVRIGRPALSSLVVLLALLVGGLSWLWWMLLR